MTLSNGWISISVRRVSGPAGKTRLPRMLPRVGDGDVRMRVRADRVGDQIAQVRFRRCAGAQLTPSSGTRVVPATVSSAVPSRDSNDATTAAVFGSSAIALVIGTSS